ncbi:MAG: geranylgeranylglyceryl/heptaprenylglyceryl phosphate synthase [Cyclobacteriaceae bacterium]|jgi:phosphoglycerol geranylgeranyltransferase|nr:geranylgeranylglyceryl/heptaprenylglyceryl phosphate synthase [Cyclobacteriaceae bacterium]MDH4294963.1 geranylgeranylglyceryl/heptaprenylglyceryl phosphate synthase [Cyclobacteriaceae bacterium]MDH5250046.1 geranylgeranylglyceryl/heptaprenylglyceryl phosphate synthase [Cyclobacteriaceae bacterium]
MSVLKTLIERHRQGKKSIAVLVDPDKADDPVKLLQLINLASENCIDFFFVGGSIITTSNLASVVKLIKENVTIPVILFPGNAIQIEPTADALLFLSLISGRNPELLIGQHVVAAPIIRNTNLEVIPTGYLLINSGRTTSVAYISNTTPIPDDKYALAACTAMAGEMLGLQSIYLDAGSGADKEISTKMIAAVRKAVNVPLIIGGGINTSQKVFSALEAGADMIVIGNALEKDPNLLIEISDRIYELNQSVEAGK